MIEKLVALFIHLKTGAISSVFLLGASGALVSATTENGVTTITITQASPSPSASVSPSPSTSPVPSASPSPAPSASPSASPSPSPSPTPSGSPIPSASPSASATPSAAPAAHACVDAVRTVNEAFQERHTTLSKMRSGKNERSDRDARGETAAVLTVKRADEILKAIRKVAVKSIHASCPSSHDDDDDDDDDDSDDDVEGRDEDDDRSGSGDLLFAGTPAEIATQATAAMDLVMQAVAAQSPLPASRDEGDDDDDEDNKDRKKDKEQGSKDKDKAKGKRK